MLGPVQQRLCHTTMLGGHIVECGADDLAVGAPDFAPHVRDFLGSLVDEEDEELALRMVLQDAVGNLLKKDSLARARRCYDEAALSFADRSEHVNNAQFDVKRFSAQEEALVRVDRRLVAERDG